VIHLRDLEVRRGERVICRLDHWEVKRGERWIVEGPNGSGKSTLLRLLAGLETPDRGHLRIDAAPKQRVFIHQSPYLFRGDVRTNLAFGLRARGFSRRERERRLAPWIETFELASLLDRRTGGLSGGERRRVALARALVLDPALILLDEPFSDLDRERSERLRERLEALSTTVIISSPRSLPGGIDWQSRGLSPG
jgi:ABC-type sugar transport system ATPase subunit